jgi:hypothetical protein
MEYLISINYTEAGPYSEGQLESMIRSGQVTLEHYVRKRNANNWVKITEIPELKIFFDKPAQSVPPVIQPVVQIEKEERKLRHGFTSFVLWLFRLGSWLGFFVVLIELGIVLDIYPVIDLGIALGTSLGIGGNFLADWLPLSSSFDLWVIRIILFLTFLSIELLFQWSRGGFWLYTFVMAASVILNPTKEEISGNLIVSAISVGILYGILQIHNAYNAKTTWEQLE